jgi:predicted phosphodiesterase
MYRLSLKILAKYPNIRYTLFGFTHNGFYEEGENLVLLNPGDIVKDRNYAVISLPRNEITFGRIAREPLPLIN